VEVRHHGSIRLHGVVFAMSSVTPEVPEEHSSALHDITLTRTIL